MHVPQALQAPTPDKAYLQPRSPKKQFLIFECNWSCAAGANSDHSKPNTSILPCNHIIECNRSCAVGASLDHSSSMSTNSTAGFLHVVIIVHSTSYIWCSSFWDIFNCQFTYCLALPPKSPLLVTCSIVQRPTHRVTLVPECTLKIPLVVPRFSPTSNYEPESQLQDELQESSMAPNSTSMDHPSLYDYSLEGEHLMHIDVHEVATRAATEWSSRSLFSHSKWGILSLPSQHQTCKNFCIFLVQKRKTKGKNEKMQKKRWKKTKKKEKKVKVKKKGKNRKKMKEKKVQSRHIILQYYFNTKVRHSRSDFFSNCSTIHADPR